MGSHKVAFPGMFAENLGPDRHNIVALSRPSSSSKHIHPIILLCHMAVSLLTQHCSKSFTEDVAALPKPQFIGLVV